MLGQEVCYHHGGSTPRGIASPHTKSGRYSKDLPTRLSARYETARSDAELLALREDVALIDARLSDVLGRVDTGESGALWSQLGKAWTRYQGASDMEQAEALAIIGDLIQAGKTDYAAWADIRSLLQERCRLVESERKRLVEMQQVITAERAMVLLAVITDTIRRHVVDRETLAAISIDLGKLVTVGTSAEPRRINGDGT